MAERRSKDDDFDFIDHRHNSQNSVMDSIQLTDNSSDDSDEEDQYYTSLDLEHDSEVEERSHAPPLLSLSQLRGVATSSPLPGVVDLTSEVIEILEENNNDPNNNLEDIQILDQNPRAPPARPITRNAAAKETHSPKPGCSKDSYFVEQDAISDEAYKIKQLLPALEYEAIYSALLTNKMAANRVEIALLSLLPVNRSGTKRKLVVEEAAAGPSRPKKSHSPPFTEVNGGEERKDNEASNSIAVEETNEDRAQESEATVEQGSAEEGVVEPSEEPLVVETKDVEMLPASATTWELRGFAPIVAEPKLVLPSHTESSVSPGVETSETIPPVSRKPIVSPAKFQPNFASQNASPVRANKDVAAQNLRLMQDLCWSYEAPRMGNDGGEATAGGSGTNHVDSTVRTKSAHSGTAVSTTSNAEGTWSFRLKGESGVTGVLAREPARRQTVSSSRPPENGEIQVLHAASEKKRATILPSCVVSNPSTTWRAPLPVTPDATAAWRGAPPVAPDASAAWRGAPPVVPDASAAWRGGLPVTPYTSAAWQGAPPVAPDASATRQGSMPVALDVLATRRGSMPVELDASATRRGSMPVAKYQNVAQPMPSPTKIRVEATSSTSARGARATATATATVTTTATATVTATSQPVKIKAESSNQERPAVAAKKVFHQKYYYRLREMFSNVSSQYVKSVCTFPEGENPRLEMLVEILLANGERYPRVIEVSAEPKKYDLETQCETLLDIFPDADPDFMRRFAEKNYDNPDAMKEFVQAKLESHDYPTKEEYLKKIKISEQQLKYTKNFNVEQFLEMFPDPFGHFENPNRKNEYDPAAFSFIKSHYYKNRISTISSYYKNCNYNISLAAKQLDLVGKDMKGNRYSLEVPTEDIPLLQEFAFVRHKSQIQDFLVNRKKQEMKEFQELKARNELLECQCCFDAECVPSKCSACTEGHIFCNPCVVKGTEAKMGDGQTTFPCFTDCTGEFTLLCLQKVLKPTTFSVLLQKRQEAEVMAAGLEGLVSCPFCHFASIPPPEDKIFKCLNPECMKESCRLCKEANHVPYRCGERKKTEEARHYLEEKMTQALIRTCYRCQRPFFKDEGCNKMTCVCGALMCYICGKKVKDYSHFNGQGANQVDRCPLYSDNRRINAEAVLQVAKATEQELLRKDPNIKINADKLLPKLPPPSRGPHEYVANANILPQAPLYGRRNAP